jgi:hypothetical protein
MQSRVEKHHKKELPQNWNPDPRVIDALKQDALNGQLSCRLATKISKDLRLLPKEIGFTIDFLELSIIKCQLGLFGYLPDKKVIQPAQSISPDLRETITNALVDGRLACKSAWDIASKFNLSKMEVASACEAMKVKISACQLGAF